MLDQPGSTCKTHDSSYKTMIEKNNYSSKPRKTGQTHDPSHENLIAKIITSTKANQTIVEV
jgi:hypothetical protein